MSEKETPSGRAAQRIRWSRQAMGWSAARLSQEITERGGSISRGTIAKIETNTRGSRGVTLDEAHFFALALRVNLGELVSPFPFSLRYVRDDGTVFEISEGNTPPAPINR